MPNFSELLQKLNLNEKQVAIFLSLVKLGKTTATNLSNDSGVTRTHVYDLVKELTDKGLVSEVEERGVKTYEAVDHTGLLAYISRQQKELQQINKKIEQMASEFKQLQLGQQQKTKVRFFEGIEGVKNLYEEIRHDLAKQTKPSEVITIFSPEKLNRLIPNFTYLDFSTVSIRAVICRDNKSHLYASQMKKTKNKVNYKFWPIERGLFPTDNIAWLNKIVFIDLSDYPSGVVIENESIVKTFALSFEEIWRGL